MTVQSPTSLLPEFYDEQRTNQFYTRVEVKFDRKEFVGVPKTVYEMIHCFAGMIDNGNVDLPYDQEVFVNELKEFNASIQYEGSDPTSGLFFGYIEKRDLLPGTKVFVRADIHGAVVDVIRNLQTLQSEGYLDEQFRCKDNVYLVFLGDYCDRGNHSVDVFRLLMALKRENPDKVTLIRGNHEDTDINIHYTREHKFLSLLGNKETIDLLNEFYQKLPLTLYLAEQVPEGKKQYVQFTHGLFELHADPHDMLANPASFATMGIKNLFMLSERVVEIPIDEKDYEKMLKDPQMPKGIRKLFKMKSAAKTVGNLFARQKELNGRNELHTTYNWGDMAKNTSRGFESHPDNPSLRAWKMSPRAVKQYLDLCGGELHKVKMLFRGHEHFMQHYFNDNKIVVTTMPIATVSEYSKKAYARQPDVFYLLTLGPKVKNWEKTLYERKLEQKYEVFRRQAMNLRCPELGVEQEAEEIQPIFMEDAEPDLKFADVPTSETS